MERNDQAGRRRLVRRPEGQVIGGVAAGIGEYIGVDPTVVRIALVIAAFVFDFWVVAVAYIAALIIIPEERRPMTRESGDSEGTITLEPDPKDSASYRPKRHGSQGLFWVGLLITAYGLYWLAEEFFGVSQYFSLVRKVSFGTLLILIGVYLIFRRRPKQEG